MILLCSIQFAWVVLIDRSKSIFGSECHIKYFNGIPENDGNTWHSGCNKRKSKLLIYIYNVKVKKSSVVFFWSGNGLSKTKI